MASTTGPVQAFFSYRKSEGGLVVPGLYSVVSGTPPALTDPTLPDPPKFDLESYISNYTGMFSSSFNPPPPSTPGADINLLQAEPRSKDSSTSAYTHLPSVLKL